MKANGNQVCVIGLGHFGAALAIALSRRSEVLALDRDMDRVNALAPHVQRALCVDARDLDALAAVVSVDFDEAIVSIGDDLEASILCALHLEQIGVKVIRAKAMNEDHAEILRAVGVSQVVFPERETAERLARRMLNPNVLEFFPLARGYSVMDVEAPRDFVGHSLLSLQIRKETGLFVIAIRKDGGETFVFLPGPDHVIEPGDVLVMIGREEDFLRLRDRSP